MDPNYLPITSLTLETIIIRGRTQYHGVNKELNVIKIHVQTDAHLLEAKRVTDVMPLGLHHNRHHLPHYATSAAVALSSESLVQTVYCVTSTMSLSVPSTKNGCGYCGCHNFLMCTWCSRKLMPKERERKFILHDTTILFRPDHIR